MITIERKRILNFDENFDYLDKTKKYKLKRVIVWIMLNIIVFPLCTCVHGLRIHGKENKKKFKELYKNGFITICNHVYMWDYICVMKAIRPTLQYHPGWKTNFEGPNGPLIRWVGGIPIPTGNMRAMGKFQAAIGDVLKDNKWLHFFPEGSMWFYYPDIRPLKKAVFKYAVRFNKPIIPITMSFRPRKGLWKLMGKSPLVDLHIGKPLFPDQNLSQGEAIDKLHKEAYHIMQVMNGINPGDATYNVDQNIDNYVKTM
jgi:1-acyl-sn-glycerol-3-phosphate acyltransferase